MEKEQSLTSEQSLELITRMIIAAKNDYYDTGISALLWGSVIIFCCMVGYANTYLNLPALNYVWWLTVVAVAPQVIISIRERKARGYRSHVSELIGGVWFSYAIAVFLFSFLDSRLDMKQGTDFCVYLTLFGIPTFATGYGRHFRPMIIGGIACWVLAILVLFIRDRNVFFLMAGGALLGWFIPGLILRKRYLKVKKQHV
jgi:hypothetical protein